MNESRICITFLDIASYGISTDGGMHSSDTPLVTK